MIANVENGEQELMQLINDDDEDDSDVDDGQVASSYTMNVLLTSNDPSVSMRYIFEQSGSGRFRRRGDDHRDKDKRR